MPDEPIDLNPSTLTAKMVEVLENWPLYRVLTFKGDVLTVGPGEVVIELPVELNLNCSLCNNLQRWRSLSIHNGRVLSGVNKDGKYLQISYVCKNCSRQLITYFLYTKISTQGGFILKVGQYPALEREPSVILKSAMDSNDLVLYRHALTCRNSNFGIGAVSYLRRIVENRINYLLDLVSEAAVNLEPESPLIEKLAEMKGEKRFSEKIDYAAELLPKSLRRGGNPIAILHELTSEGLHAKSDDECVDIFDRCKLAFEHVIKRLKEDKDEDEGYRNAMQTLSSKAAKKSNIPKS